MAQRKSTGLVNFMADSGSARNALSNSRIFIYTGTQPSTADSAATGTLLVTLTKNGGAFTAETLPVWRFTLSGSSGSVNSVKVGGIECLSSSVAFATDLSTTAANVATNITETFSIPDFKATSSGASVIITGPFACGASLNNLNVVVACTTLVPTYDDSGHTGAVYTAGVTAVNGCNFQFPASVGVLSKETTDWSGIAIATGTAGWFRFESDPADDKAISTTYKRLDGAISTSGAEMNLSTTSVTSGGTFTINSANFTVVK